MAWLMLAGAILAEVTATLALRASEGFAKWGWLFPVLAGYGVAFFLLSLVLKAGMPVGVAYGVWAACGVALTAILGALVFRDPFTRQMALGIVLIGAGVILLETGGSANTHPG